MAPAQTDDQRRTALYRAYDADGNLLYVGISDWWASRLWNHATTKWWFASITRVDVTYFADRASAMTAEIEAIRSEAPAHNAEHNDRRRLSTNKLVTLRFQRGWSQARTAREAGLNQSYYSQLEKGRKTKPSDRVVEAIAGALGVEPSELADAFGVDPTELEA